MNRLLVKRRHVLFVICRLFRQSAPSSFLVVVIQDKVTLTSIS